MRLKLIFVPRSCILMLILDSIKTFTGYRGLVMIIEKNLKDLVVDIQLLRFLES